MNSLSANASERDGNSPQSRVDVGRGDRRALAALVYWTGLFALRRWFNRRELLVLTYHGVVRRHDGGFLKRNCVSVEEFSRHLRFLKRHYRLLSLEEALDGLAGKRPLPPNSALITFDDGFRNNAALAAPVLAHHGVPAVMFVTTGMLDHPGCLPWIERLSAMLLLTRAPTLEVEFDGQRQRYDLAEVRERVRASNELRRYLKTAPSAIRARVMKAVEHQCPLAPGDLDPERFEFMSWDEARVLVHRGIDIGSHTVRHVCLSGLDPAELRDEVITSRQRIEEQLGRPCLAFAYPDGAPGSFGPRDREALSLAGYRAAFTQIRGTNRVGDDLFTLKRFNVAGGTGQLATLILTLVGLRRNPGNGALHSSGGPAGPTSGKHPPVLNVPPRRWPRARRRRPSGVGAA